MYVVRCCSKMSKAKCSNFVNSVSPQHFTSLAIHDHRYNGYCLIDMPGCGRILLSYSHDNDASFTAPQKSNTLYFIDGSSPGSSGPRVSHLATKPQLLSELWHQRLGHNPNPNTIECVGQAQHWPAVKDQCVFTPHAFMSSL
jgi:hypothetical protein